MRATNRSVGRGVAEWRELREHKALKGRKLYRNRDSVDPIVCSIMSGLCEMFIAIYSDELFVRMTVHL